MVKKIWDETIIFLRKLGLSSVGIAKITGAPLSTILPRYCRLTKSGYITPMSKPSFNFIKAARDLAKKRHLEKVEKVVNLIKKNGGYVSASDIRGCTSLVIEGYLLKVKLSLKWGQGGYYRRGNDGNIFKEEFRGKTFYLLNDRTSLVRFLSKVITPPGSDRGKRVIIYHFLRRHLTRAETIAVMWKLGVRSWNHMRGKVMIDGVVR